MTKQVQTLIQNNIKFNNMPNEYILYMNKHITANIYNKFDILKQFAEKNHGEIKVIKEPYISGINYQMIIELIADITAMKEFDSLIASK